ncbi:MAG: helicase [Glaciihabitans sp.]|nr:helicase [Glaciihabitans sp.]
MGITARSCGSTYDSPGKTQNRQRGAASILGVAIIGMLLAAVTMMLPLYIGMGVKQAVVAAADAAALAAADVAVGIEPGVPCEVAATVAEANTSALVGCALDGVVVTVSTSRTILGLTVVATATAGPPGSTVN